MAYDVECPYCGEGQDINHDDGQGYEEGKRHEQQCGECEKNFIFNTSISFYYEAEQADCLNGFLHNLEPITHYPDIWPDWVRCKDCDYEHRGQYVPPREEKQNDQTN